MFVYCEDTIQCGWIPHAFEPPEIHGTFIAKITCQLVPNETARMFEGDDAELISGDLYYDDDPNQGLLYASDFVPFKVKADLLLVATAHSTGGVPAESFNVQWQVGEWSKRLRIFGDRRWIAEPLSIRTSNPVATRGLPIRYANAFGGRASKFNPIGKGYGNDVTNLPNIEESSGLVKHPNDEIAPAGFGPLAGNWHSRQRNLGTYDAQWKKTRWPWFPKDFDYSYFNSAPTDQQLHRSLIGNETLVFENLHPKHSNYRTQLPGVRLRCFIGESGWELTSNSEAFREVVMQLDTLQVNMELEKATLTWRGTTPVRSLKMREIENVFFLAESVAENARSREECYAWCMDRKHAGDEVESDATADAAAIAAEKEEQLEADKSDEELMAVIKKAEEFEAEAMRGAVAAGISPAAFAKGSSASIADVKASMLTAAELTKDSHPAASAEYLSAVKDLTELETIQADMAELETIPLTREEVIRMAAAGESFAECNLAELELHDLHFVGLNFTGADLTECMLDGTSFKNAILTNAKLTAADLTDADLDGACLDGADFSESILENAILTNTSIAETVFADLALPGIDFRGAHGFAPDFSGAELSSAKFCACSLPQSNFSGATLVSADFREADLTGAQFEQVKAQKIQMSDANLSGLHGSDGSDFTDGNFCRANADGSIWEDSILDGADFTEAKLQHALFTQASLKRANFDRADLASAVLDDADLSDSSLEQTNLLRASMDRANLSRASLRESNLYNAGFWETQFHDSDLRGAHIKGTSLPL